jgi:tetratricopeptide (TPR) repeat protein
MALSSKVRPTYGFALALIAAVVAFVFYLTEPPVIHKDGHGIQRPTFGPFGIAWSWVGGHETPWTPLGFVAAFDRRYQILSGLLLVAIVLLILLVRSALRARRTPPEIGARHKRPLRVTIGVILALIAVVAIELGWEVNSWRGWPARLKYLLSYEQYQGSSRAQRDRARHWRDQVPKMEAAASAPRPSNNYASLTNEAYVANFKSWAAMYKRRASEAEALADHAERMEQKYARALAHPREPVPPDPPPPPETLDESDWLARNDYRRALEYLEAELRQFPDLHSAHKMRAWILATCRDAQFRNGKVAVESAKRACELDNWGADSIATLAAAYAESGDYPSAVRWQTKAVDMLKSTEKTPPHLAIMRLADYQAGKPCRWP